MAKWASWVRNDVFLDLEVMFAFMDLQDVASFLSYG